jgi:hypothetical protein
MMCRGVEEIHEFILTLGRGEWSASHPSDFTSKVTDHGTCWVGPRASLDAVSREKFLAPPQD